MRVRGGRAAWIAALCLGAGGCLLPGYSLQHQRDDFARTETWRMQGNALSVPPGADDWVALDAEAVRPRGDSVSYAFIVDYRSGDEPLGLRRGESLIVLADTARFTFSTAGARLDEDVRGPRETARYPVPADAMRRIATAGQIRVRVVGRRYYVDRVVTNRGLWRFRRLMEAVEGIPVPPRPPRRRPAAPRPPAPGSPALRPPPPPG